MQIISIDNGRDSLKGVAEGKQITFPSVVGEHRERNISKGGEYEVIVDGTKRFIGDLAIYESDYKREMVKRTKIHEETKILTLAAVALLAEPGQKIRLITGLPVDQFTDEMKDEYKKLLGGSHVVEINGTKHTIAIDDAMGISIEGAGSYWSIVDNEPEIQKQKVRVIDIGSRTVNALTIAENSRFIDKDSITLDYGCLKLGENPAQEQLEQFARRIVGDLSKKWMDYNQEKVLLSGGGALLLRDYLVPHYNIEVVNDPVFANAKGFYRLGVLKWQSKK